MSHKIQTIEDASKVCTNNVRLVGELNEFSIEFSDPIGEDERVYVNYVGVVNVNDSYIQIHGSLNNMNPNFYSAIEKLKTLKPNLFTLFRQGEVVETEYSDECSLVYIEGRVSSAKSIKVDYISSSNSDAIFLLGALTGVPIEKIDDNHAKVLIINNDFHNVITFECDKHGVVLENMIGKTINFSIKANKNKDTSPLSLEYMIEILDGVPKNVVDNAMAEHDVYLSMRKQYG